VEHDRSDHITISMEHDRLENITISMLHLEYCNFKLLRNQCIGMNIF